MKKLFNILSAAGLLAILSGPSAASAAIPAGYYNALEGLSGVNLMSAVKAVARNHTAISYGESGTWQVFKESDTRYVNGQLVWWDMYSNENVPATNGHSGLNIEHSVANSWWGKTNNDAYKDLFHLNPSNSDANSRKSNYPLGEIQTITWDNGVTFVGRPVSGQGGGSNYVYEPADEYKGDFARAFFYIFTIYNDLNWSSSWDWMYNPSDKLLLREWAYKLLLKWSEQDPVSQKEIDRNEVIYKHQHNRNPFIDHPELAEHIWGSKNTVPFHADGNIDPDPDPDPDPDDPVVDPDPDTPKPEAGYWYAVTSATDLNSDDRYVIVSTERNMAMSTTSGGTNYNKYFQPTRQNPVVDTSVTPARLTSVPSDVAVITLTRNDKGWVLALSDLDGKLSGYLCSTQGKSLSTVSSPTTEGCTASITASPTKTSISYSYAGTSQPYELLYNYNENGNRFTTYASALEPVMLYRFQENASAGLETGSAETQPEVIQGIFDVNGRKMATNEVSQLSPGIYIVVSNFGARKILKTP